MSKLLSLIIPTYNMAALLPRCVESLVQAKSIDTLDILIVNDGSKDNSLQVAREWEKKYPQSIRVIDKPNGNYGSTINAALPIAEGMYVKVLDSDDWFDTAALDALLTEIERFAQSNTQTEGNTKTAKTDTCPDMLHTPFTQIGATTREVIRYNTMGREPYEYGKIYQLDDILPDGYIRFFLMHALAYRTEMLRSMHYRQTEGISYTDTEWSCYPLFAAQTIVFLPHNVYQYNLDREGQTMDPKVLMKSVNQMQTVTDAMLAYYESHRSVLSDVRAAWMKQYFENRLRILYKIYLLDMPRADFRMEDLQAMDEKYFPTMQRLDLHPRLYPENKLLRIEYIGFWHRHHRRWSRPMEAFNHLLDVCVKWLYIRLFRR